MLLKREGIDLVALDLINQFTEIKKLL